MDGLLQKLMDGIRTVLTGPGLAVGLLLAALMMAAVGSGEEADG